MALRRPPTRVELKADDIDEYTKLMREREMSMEDPAVTVADQYGPNGSTNNSRADGGGRVKWSAAMTPNTKKADAAERIGIGRPG